MVALAIVSSIAAPVDAEPLNPSRLLNPLSPTRPLPLPASPEVGKQLIQNKPEIRLEGARQIASKVLDLDPEEVGIGDRKIMNLASYDLGDGETAWVNLRQASLSYGLGVHTVNLLNFQKSASAKALPFDIHLAFAPGDEESKLFVVSLDGFLDNSAKIKYDAFSENPPRYSCKACQVNISPGSSTAHLIVEPAYPTEMVNVEISIEGYAAISTIDITAIKS
jgi:hypothetical protein